VQTEASRAGVAVWKRFLELLYADKKYYKLLSSFSDFEKTVGDSNKTVQEAKKIARKALSELSDMLLKKGNFMELLNYHAKNREMIHSLNANSVHYNIGRAWQMAGVPDAAMKAFYLEYQTSGKSKTGAKSLLALARAAVSDGKADEALDALTIYDSITEESSISPEVSLLKARASYEAGDWLAAFNLAKDTLSDNATAGQGGEILFKAAVMLGRWEYARRAWSRFSERFTQKNYDLQLWGDTALELAEPSVAIEAYSILLEAEPDNPATIWKVAKAKKMLNDMEGAKEMTGRLANANDSFWADIASSETAYQDFMNGIAGEL
jgi:tetratricopeptide (TPR) repeat protein